jgi:hypothetical protein
MDACRDIALAIQIKAAEIKLPFIGVKPCELVNNNIPLVTPMLNQLRWKLKLY